MDRHTTTALEEARRSLAEDGYPINAVMLTCGTYDAVGDFAFRVGMPGKSGVGGGIVALIPDRLSVAVWSPGLNAKGNSLAGAVRSREVPVAVVLVLKPGPKLQAIYSWLTHRKPTPPLF